MKSRCFLLALLLSCTFMSSTIQAIASPLSSYDITEDKKDPRPKPKPGPRGGGDDDD